MLYNVHKYMLIFYFLLDLCLLTNSLLKFLIVPFKITGEKICAFYK